MLDPMVVKHLEVPTFGYVAVTGKKYMVPSNFKGMRNKWALHAWDNHALYAKLGDSDRSGERFLVEELYQTNPMGKIKTISIGSNFCLNAVVCRKNIIEWLKIFYPDLRKVT